MLHLATKAVRRRSDAEAGRAALAAHAELSLESAPRARTRSRLARTPGMVGLAIAVVLGVAACGSATADPVATSKPAVAAVPQSKLKVLAPTDASTVRSGHVLVRGTIAPTGAQVQVMGKPAEVADGMFRASVPVQIGENTIDVVAIATGAQPVTTTIVVTRGRTEAQIATAAAASDKRQARAAAARKAKAARSAKARKARSDRRAARRAADCIVVPDVVGMVHQKGQDTMQAAGLYALAELDATGQDRLLLYDRNWIDVEQDPAAGECVSADTTVTLSAKKKDD